MDRSAPYVWVQRRLTSGPHVTRWRVLALAVVFTPPLLGALSSPHTGFLHDRPTGIAAIVVLAVLSPLCRRYVDAYAVVSLVVFLVTGQTVCLAIALYAATRERRLVWVAVMMAVPSVLSLASPDSLIVHTSHAGFTLATNWLLTLAPVMVGIAVNQGETNAGLLADHEREEALLRESLLRERRYEQRDRLVRTIHDGVGHQISLMAVQSMAIAARPDTAPEVREKCGLIQDAGAGAMEALRNVLRVMKDDEADGPDGPDGLGEPEVSLADLDDLVSTYRQYGLDITARIDPNVDAGPASGTLLFQAAEEGFSNAVRHARGADVTLRLAEVEPGTVLLEVTNTAPDKVAADSALPGTGHGLGRLAAAVKAAGGALAAGPDGDGGYLLAVRLPIAN
ncbi:histidine kinase [Streptomyces sp. NPDC051940]|uniref:sensor histidine kinase n=1 Tax=Streptomyces sp. NPDC051940 TaxID=3155675 RepID=UPI0034285BBC